MECTLSRLRVLFSIPTPMQTPTPICHDLGVGVGIRLGVDFFYLNSIQFESLGGHL